MAEALNYNSLLSDVRRYIERGGTADAQVYAQLPRLINQAERAIARDLKIQGFQDVLNSDLNVGVSVYLKPDRWRTTVSMELGDPVTEERSPLFARSYEYCRSYWPDSAVRAKPLFYADYDYRHWLIAPTPDQTYPWELIVYRLPALLDESNQTNWLTDYAPTSLLYRTLLEVAPFLIEDARLATWRDFYQEAINGINVEDLRKIVDRNSTRKEA